MAGVVEEELHQRLAHARVGAVLPCAGSRRLLPHSSLFLRPCTKSSEPFLRRLRCSSHSGRFICSIFIGLQG